MSAVVTFSGDAALDQQVRDSFGPSNDHELAIARIVDRIQAEGRLYLESIQEVVTVVDFMMSASDSDFLVNYVRWRMDHPIVK